MKQDGRENPEAGPKKKQHRDGSLSAGHLARRPPRRRFVIQGVFGLSVFRSVRESEADGVGSISRKEYKGSLGLVWRPLAVPFTEKCAAPAGRSREGSAGRMKGIRRLFEAYHGTKLVRAPRQPDGLVAIALDKTWPDKGLGTRHGALHGVALR